MKLYLIGHDYRYAAEQILLALFPGEKPEYPAGAPAEENSAELRLTFGAKYASARTVLRRGGTHAGSARVRLSALAGKLARDRELQRILKLSFYRAAAGTLAAPPPWGALTGIRPGTIFTKALERGMTPAAAQRYMEREYFVSSERSALLRDTSRASLAAKAALGPRQAALYAGIPFCPTRCAYCSFVSQSVEKSMGLIPPFLAAMDRDIGATARAAAELGLRINSVYIGGGTPTTLSAPQLSRLIARLRSAFSVPEGAEFSVEAGRPDTITDEKLAALHESGVTRISINPQSMADGVIAAIGRKHTAEDIRRAYAAARRAGRFDVNMDLIAGLPADTPEQFARSLSEVIALGPENITVHTLSLKKGSRITLEDTNRPDAAAVSEMLSRGARTLRAAGYAPYYLYRQKFMSGGFENVGWCLPGKECRYNILIMEELCTVLAVGGGASTKLVDPARGRIERLFAPKYPGEYIAGIEKTLAAKARIAEFYESME